jgi:hypothetical protein
VANLLPVSLILVANFAPSSTGVVDNGGKFAMISLTPVANLPPLSTTPVELGAKFAAGVIDTSGKFAARVVDNSGNFAACVLDTGGATWWQVVVRVTFVAQKHMQT